jgi:hypothetical protein
MNNQPRGFKITFFLPDGTPEGMKIIEKSNWIGRAIVCPRPRFADLKERLEFKKTGVYLLIDEGAANGTPRVYIGEGDPVGDRLIQHQKLKDFWSSVVFFTSKDENLNKAHVQYLESRLLSLARLAKRCDLENGNAPTLPSLSEADRAEMDEFLEQMLLIYPAIGISVFEKPMAATPATQLLYLNAKGLTAAGYEVDGGFVVREGSQASKLASPATPDAVCNLRKSLVAQGVLVDDADHLRLAQDYTFTSPSIAAAIMLGRSANGRTEWKDATGRTLKELQEVQIDGAAGATA